MYSHELPCTQATHYRSKKIQPLLSGHSKDYGIKESVMIHQLLLLREKGMANAKEKSLRSS